MKMEINGWPTVKGRVLQRGAPHHGQRIFRACLPSSRASEEHMIQYVEQLTGSFFKHSGLDVKSCCTSSRCQMANTWWSCILPSPGLEQEAEWIVHVGDYLMSPSMIKRFGKMSISGRKADTPERIKKQ